MTRVYPKLACFKRLTKQATLISRFSLLNLKPWIISTTMSYVHCFWEIFSVNEITLVRLSTKNFSDIDNKILYKYLVSVNLENPVNACKENNCEDTSPKFFDIFQEIKNYMKCILLLKIENHLKNLLSC